MTMVVVMNINMGRILENDHAHEHGSHPGCDPCLYSPTTIMSSAAVALAAVALAGAVVVGIGCCTTIYIFRIIISLATNETRS
jgi:hypothetical protein